jgi:predicted DNA-binding transcriptional regulator AlpA
MLNANTSDLLWAAKSVASHLDISMTTLWRMRRRPGFPRPVIINGRLYWRVAEVISWARELPAASPEEEEALRQRLPGYSQEAVS